MFNELKEKILSKNAKIGVIGLGYVGLPLAVAFAKKGFKVWGIDIDKDRVSRLKKGQSYILDLKPSDIVTLQKDKSIVFQTDEQAFDLQEIDGHHTLISRVNNLIFKAPGKYWLEVLLDDRDERPGVMFADLELIGIPHRIVIGDRSLKEGNVEYQGRSDSAAQVIALSAIVEFVQTKQ